MNRPQFIREVYFELRRALADKVSQREVLESATALVDLFTLPEEDGPRFEIHNGGLPFDLWALDVAFADGGWRVMAHEARLAEELEMDERLEVRTHIGMRRMALEMMI